MMDSCQEKLLMLQQTNKHKQSQDNHQNMINPTINLVHKNIMINNKCILGDQVKIIFLLYYTGILQNIIGIQNMETERNITFLSSVDLKNKNILESRHSQAHSYFQENWPYEVQLTSVFPTECLLTHVEIECEKISAKTSGENIKNNICHYVLENCGIFIGLQIQCSSIEHRGHTVLLIESSLVREDNKILITGAAFSQTIKFRFLTKPGIGRKKPRDELEEEITKSFDECIKQISLYGIAANSYPLPSLSTNLLNISQKFKKFKMNQQGTQTELLAALSLISARRFVQASELLKKISQFYVYKHTINRTALDFSKNIEKSWLKEDDQIVFSNISLMNTFSNRGKMLETNKFLLKAAKTQLLLADSILNPSLFIEKLSAYHRCQAYHEGNPSPTQLPPDVDLEQTCSKMASNIIPFFIKILADKVEPYRIAALKSIEFFIQTLGCNVGTNLVLVLKQVIATYPNTNMQSTTNNSLSMMEFLSESYNNPNNIVKPQTDNNITSQNLSNKLKNKTLIDHYHHLLQTLLSILNQVNRKILHSLFSEIIVPSLISKGITDELKLYLLRFSQKIIQLVGPDLPINANFVATIMTLCEKKPKKEKKSTNSKRKNSATRVGGRRDIQSATHKPVLSTLIYFSFKVLNLIKVKILPNSSGSNLESILIWINKLLTYFGENQLLPNNSHNSLSNFTTILDFIEAIYCNSTHIRVIPGKISHNPIDSLLYYLNISIHQNDQHSLPFDKILSALTSVLKYFGRIKNETSQKISAFYLSFEIISRLLEKSKISNLSEKQLKVLSYILSIVEDPPQEDLFRWFEQFLDCIPHSTYDETYEIFTIFLKITHKNLNQTDSSQIVRLYKKIMKILLDQYTVKGKAYHEAKQELLRFVIENRSQASQILKICLIQNQQPKVENYYRNSRSLKINQNKNTNHLRVLPDYDSEHKFDTKAFRIDQQIFIEKLSFAQIILSKIGKFSSQQEKSETEVKQCFGLFFRKNEGCLILQQILESLQKLCKSKILKIKLKALNILHYLVEIILGESISEQGKSQVKIEEIIVFAREVFGVYRKFLMISSKENKIMYSILFGIANLVKKIQQFQSHSNQANEQIKIEGDWFQKMDKITQNLPVLLQPDNSQLLISCQNAQNSKKQAYIEIIEQLVEKTKEEQLSHRQISLYLGSFAVKQFLKLWHLISPLITSPWENVKQMFLILILEILINGIIQVPEPLRKKVLDVVFPLITTLLKSIDTTQRLFGLKIFGTLLGLRGPLPQSSNDSVLNSAGNRNFIWKKISQNSVYLSVFNQKIYELKANDWNDDVCAIANKMLCLTLNEQKIELLRRKFELQRKLNNNSILDNSFLSSLNLCEQTQRSKNVHYLSYNQSTSQNFESLLMKESTIFDEQIDFINQGEGGDVSKNEVPEITENAFQTIIDFRLITSNELLSKGQNFCEKQSFLVQAEDQLYEMIGDERGYIENETQSLEGRDKSEDEQLEFEDLGIIELDDEGEDWGEEQQQDILNNHRISEGFSSKKIYNYKHKLSPSVIMGSSKPQRIRSKRYHQHEYDSPWSEFSGSNYKERIIVDELEQKQQKMINQNKNKAPDQSMYLHRKQAQNQLQTKERQSHQKEQVYDSDENIYSYEEELDENEHDKVCHQTKREPIDDQQMNQESYFRKEKIGKGVSHGKIEEQPQNVSKGSSHPKSTKAKKKKNAQCINYELNPALSTTLPGMSSKQSGKKTSSRRRQSSTGK